MHRRMEVETAAETSVLHLESLARMLELPIMKSTWSISSDMYGKVKHSSRLFNWTLTTAESAVYKTFEHAAPIAAPIFQKLEHPIQTVDRILCEGLAIVEEKLPVLKEQPEKIYDSAKVYFESTFKPTKEKVCAAKEYGTTKVGSLKELSLLKANEILSTHYGSIAVDSIGSTAALVKQYFYHYFPPTEEKTPEVAENVNGILSSIASSGGYLSSYAAGRLHNILFGQTEDVTKKNVEELIPAIFTILQYIQECYQLHIFNMVTWAQFQPSDHQTL